MRPWSLDGEGLAGHRVFQSELRCVQSQPADQGLFVLASLVAGFEGGQHELPIRVAVKWIVEDRCARRSEVHAQLVRPAGEWTAFHKGESPARAATRAGKSPAGAKALQRAELGAARLAAAALEYSHPPRLPFVLSERHVDDERARQQAGVIAHWGHHLHRLVRRKHHDECVVHLVDRLALKLAADKIERGLCFRADQDAARIGIEPVNIRHRPAVTRMSMYEPHQVLARLVPAVGRDQQSAGFVERDERIVFKKNRGEWHAVAGFVAEPAVKSSLEIRKWLENVRENRLKSGTGGAMEQIRLRPGGRPRRLTGAPPMFVWPKSIYTFSVNWRTAATGWKLRRKRSAIRQQEQTFSNLMRELSPATFWREAGVECNLAYPIFQSRVAPRSPEQLAPAIARMKRGEAGVLCPGKCSLFLSTCGTVNGHSNHVPVTEPLRAHYRRAAFDTLLYYTVRARHSGVFGGRHLWLGGSAALKPVEGLAAASARVAEAPGIAAVDLPLWMERHVYEPTAEIAQIEDWPTRLNAIAGRASGLDISLFGALPRWAVVFARTLLERSATPARRVRHLQELWPNFECFVHTGVPVGPFYEELRELLGPTVRFHEVYAASEAFIATQDGEPGAGLRLMADAGVFFEFLPLAEFDELRLKQLGPRLIPLAGVTSGIDYALFVTTPGGLVRYALGDVVRFVSTEPPRLIYVGRTTLRLHAFGENVLEKEITEALTTVCDRHGWSVANFHVAPLFASNRTGAIRGRHEWWVELRAGSVETPRGPDIAEKLEVELQRLNPNYAAKRRAGIMEAPIVRLVMPGVFQHWLRFSGKWGGQFKTPRCRSDRQVAGVLAQITNFAQD